MATKNLKGPWRLTLMGWRKNAQHPCFLDFRRDTPQGLRTVRLFATAEAAEVITAELLDSTTVDDLGEVLGRPGVVMGKLPSGARFPAW